MCGPLSLEDRSIVELAVDFEGRLYDLIFFSQSTATLIDDTGMSSSMESGYIMALGGTTVPVG